MRGIIKKQRVELGLKDEALAQRAKECNAAKQARQAAEEALQGSQQQCEDLQTRLRDAEDALKESTQRCSALKAQLREASGTRGRVGGRKLPVTNVAQWQRKVAQASCAAAASRMRTTVSASRTLVCTAVRSGVRIDSPASHLQS